MQYKVFLYRIGGLRQRCKTKCIVIVVAVSTVSQSLDDTFLFRSPFLTC